MNNRHDDSAAKAVNDMADQIASLTATLDDAYEALKAAYKFHAELGADYKHLVNHVILDALFESLLSIEKARGKV